MSFRNEQEQKQPLLDEEKKQQQPLVEVHLQFANQGIQGIQFQLFYPYARNDQLNELRGKIARINMLKREGEDPRQTLKFYAGRANDLIFVYIGCGIDCEVKGSDILVKYLKNMSQNESENKSIDEFQKQYKWLCNHAESKEVTHPRKVLDCCVSLLQSIRAFREQSLDAETLSNSRRVAPNTTGRCFGGCCVPATIMCMLGSFTNLPAWFCFLVGVAGGGQTAMTIDLANHFTAPCLGEQDSQFISEFLETLSFSCERVRCLALFLLLDDLLERGNPLISQQEWRNVSNMIDNAGRLLDVPTIEEEQGHEMNLLFQEPEEKQQNRR